MVRHNYVLNEFGTPKSEESERAVPLADPVAVELARLDKATGERGDAALVFPDPFTGGPLGKAAILRRFKRALKAAKLDETHRFHDLRHTFGTRMAAQNTAMRDLQQWMGHADIQTTQIYAAYQPKKRQADLIEAAFGHEESAAVEVAA
jgi:integrase